MFTCHFSCASWSHYRGRREVNVEKLRFETTLSSHRERTTSSSHGERVMSNSLKPNRFFCSWLFSSGCFAQPFQDFRAFNVAILLVIAYEAMAFKHRLDTAEDFRPARFPVSPHSRLPLASQFGK